MGWHGRTDERDELRHLGKRMTMQPLLNALRFPESLNGQSGTNPTIAATTTRQYTFMQVPASGMLQKVFLPIATGDGTTTLRMRIETVSNSSAVFQTNTLLATGSEAVTGGLTVGNYDVPLDIPVAVTKGQLIAVQFRAETYSTPVGIMRASPQFTRNGYPMFGTVSTPTGSITRSGLGVSSCALMIDGVWCYQSDVLPISYVGGTFHTLNGTSDPTEIGNRFVMPYGARISGAWFSGQGSVDAGLVSINVYNAASTLLATTTNPVLNQVITAAAGDYPFPTPVDVAAGDVLRLGIRRLASSLTTRILPIVDTAHAAAMPGQGNVYRTGRATAGAWIDDPLQLVCAGLLISHVDTGSASNRKIKIGGAFVAA